MHAATADPATIELALAPLRSARPRAAILCDVDGTLAPIVARPEEAAVSGRARTALRELAGSFDLVACVSGRRALEARAIVGLDDLVYVGNHGLEWAGPGEAEPRADQAIAGRAGDAERFVAGLDGKRLRELAIRVEDKGPIQALHWRGAREPAAAEAAALELAELAREAGLHPHWGRRVLELRPLTEVDKGTAVRRLLTEAEVHAALYAGDDRTDLDAFAALRGLAGAATLEAAVCVGVVSDEGPAEIAAEADLAVAGVDGTVAVLEALAAA